MTTLATIELDVLDAVTGSGQGWLHPPDEEPASHQSWLHPEEEKKPSHEVNAWLRSKSGDWTSCRGGFWHGCPPKPNE